MRIRTFTFSLGMMLGLSCWCFCGCAVAAGGGAVIDAGEISGGAGGGGGGGSYVDCGSNMSIIDCTGYSWMFYRATNDVTNDIYFTPMHGGDAVVISGECAKHPDSGFWHFGMNAGGLVNDGLNYFIDYTHVHGVHDYAGSSYVTWPGSYGHANTYTRDFVNKTWEGWDGYKAPTWHGHHLYYGDKVAYYSEKVATSFNDSGLLADYKKACEYSNKNNGTSFTCDGGVAGSVRYFCYWEGMSEPVKLSAYAVSTDGTLLNNGKPISGTPVSVEYGKSTTVKADTISGYGFIKWVPAASNSNKGCNSTAISGPVLSTNASYTTSNLTANGTICAVYGQNVLTATAVDTSGKSISSAVSNVTARAGYNTTASVTRRTVSGYTFKGWRATATGGYVTNTSTSSATYVSGSSNPKETYNVKNLTGNTTVYAVYEVDAFQGKTAVSGSATGDTGWVNTDKSMRVTIENCSSYTGCKVKFEHHLKRNSGSGKSPYSIERTSNLTETNRGVQAGIVKNGTLVDTGDVTVSSSNLTLYPGMIVCERLSFKPSNLSGATSVATKICVSTLGDAQPSEVQLLDMKVRNESVARFNSYAEEVYAKPGDKIHYRASYHPILQYTYFLKPEKMQVQNSTVYPSGTTVFDKCALGDPLSQCKIGSTSSTSLFNYYGKNHGAKDWNNDYAIYSSNGMGSSLLKSKSNDNGDMSEIIEDDSKNDVTVSVTMVGKDVNRKIRTNAIVSGRTTPFQVQFMELEGFNRANVYVDPQEKMASVKVPYNFTITTEVSGLEDAVMPGEEVTIDAKYIINPKRNDVTDGAYITPVSNGKYSVSYTVGGGEPQLVSEKTENFDIYNSDDITKAKSVPVTPSFVVPDVPAGTEICVRSKAWPASSGDSYNTDKNKFEDRWVESEEKCFKVGKKPTLQVWGGNVYSSGMMNVESYPKSIKTGNGTETVTKTFGSWGELGVITGVGYTGEYENKFLASGASLGYGGMSSEGKLQFANSGGSNSGKCSRALLMIPNQSVCQNSGSANLDSVSLAATIKGNKNAISGRYGLENSLGVEVADGESVMIGGGEGEDVVHYYRGSNFRLAGNSSLSEGNTYIVYANENGGTITITEDISYLDGNYAKFSALPRVIVYAETVNILCEVNRIDALIVAGGNVNTCSDIDDDNASERSNPLRVNGAIVSAQLNARRTYGAASGVNSIVPAETIVFDPSLYLFGGQTSGSGADGLTLEMVNIKEKAPRL